MIPTPKTIKIDRGVPFALPVSDPVVSCAIGQGFRFRDPACKIAILEGDTLLPNQEWEDRFSFILWDEGGSYFGISISHLGKEGWKVTCNIYRSFVRV